MYNTQNSNITLLPFIPSFHFSSSPGSTISHLPMGAIWCLVVIATFVIQWPSHKFSPFIALFLIQIFQMKLDIPYEIARHGTCKNDLGIVTGVPDMPRIKNKEPIMVFG